MISFADRYLRQLRNLLQYCNTREVTEFTPSDFETADLSQEELDRLFGP